MGHRARKRQRLLCGQVSEAAPIERVPAELMALVVLYGGNRACLCLFATSKKARRFLEEGADEETGKPGPVALALALNLSIIEPVFCRGFRRVGVPVSPVGFVCGVGVG